MSNDHRFYAWAAGYAARMKNRRKREFAESYALYVSGATQVPPTDDRLSLMAKQAVRLAILEAWEQARKGECP